MIRILLVDDHPSVGEGTKTMLEQDPETEVTVLVSPVEALEVLKYETFDVCLFDLNMPVFSGIELTKRILSIYPDTKILIYTGYEISSHFNLLVESGACGFISKTSTREQLHNAIRCALREESVIPVGLLKQLRRTEVRLSQLKSDKVHDDVSINEKEQEILQEVALGKSNKDIAGRLFISQRTVEYNLTRIFQKLKVSSRSEAIVEASRLGLVHIQEFE